MNKDELIALSDSTFIDNDAGEIQPAGHRAFNEQLIESVPELVPYIGENIISSRSFYEPKWPIYSIKDEDIGQKMCFSISVKNTSGQKAYINIYNENPDSGGIGAKGSISVYISEIEPSNQYITLSRIISIPDKVRTEGRNLYFGMPFDHVTKWSKLEYGEVPTPYIPASKEIAVNIDDTSLSEQLVPNKLFLDPQSGQAKQLYRKTYKFSKQINSGSFSSILEQTLPLTYRIVNVNGCAYRRADGGVFPIPYYWNGTDDYIGNISVYSRKNTNNMVLLCVGNGIRSFSDKNIDVVITIEYIKD